MDNTTHWVFIIVSAIVCVLGLFVSWCAGLLAGMEEEKRRNKTWASRQPLTQQAKQDKPQDKDLAHLGVRNIQ